MPRTQSLAAVALLAASAAAQTNDIRIENRVPIPMRDGVVLYADVYRPAGEGKHPVLVSRTPYSTERAPAAYAAPVFFARRGYAFVFQDVRGRHESEGKWDPFRNEQDDGYDTIEWAARQPWSNGKVGTQGASYLGHVQWQAAMKAPPHLVAVFPNLAPTSIYLDTLFLNGGFRLSLAFGWGPVRQESRIMQNIGMHMEGAPDGIDFGKILWHLPLVDMQRRIGRNAGFYTEWLRHPDYDDYWKALSVEEAFERIPVPAQTFGGWFDILEQGTLRGYIGMSTKGKTQTARRGSRMVVGPWGHGPTRKYGDLDFGEQAYVDPQERELRWYDYWLNGIDNGLAQEPPVRLFTMGRNQWRWENEYPLARTEYRKMYFHSAGGRANSNRGDGRLGWEPPSGEGAPARYRYDPEDPVPSVGGNNCCGAPTPAGPVDQRPVETRNDVLVYTSDILAEELDITGPVQVLLYASSDAPDTDFIAKLVDVYPDGKAYNMAEGILRARYREGLGRPLGLEPGKVYPLTIDLVGTSNAFLKGHRIRVSVASSHFPQFDRNPNTGEPFGMSAGVRVASQAVYATRRRPSHIVLPVIPAAGR